MNKEELIRKLDNLIDEYESICAFKPEHILISFDDYTLLNSNRKGVLPIKAHKGIELIIKEFCVEVM